MRFLTKTVLDKWEVLVSRNEKLNCKQNVFKKQPLSNLISHFSLGIYLVLIGMQMNDLWRTLGANSICKFYTSGI